MIEYEVMNGEIYDDIALEQQSKEKFGFACDVDYVVLRNVPVSRVATATLFLTKKKQLMLYVNATSKLLLKDVETIVSRMGLRGELYLPPKGRPNYFDEIGADKFKKVFPGRHDPSANDLLYYRTLAPYNPALIQINEVKYGEVKIFDADATGNWRVGARFAYRRIKTS